MRPIKTNSFLRISPSFYKPAIFPSRVTTNISERIISNYIKYTYERADLTDHLSELGSLFITQSLSIAIDSIDHFSDKNTASRSFPYWRRLLIVTRDNINYKEENFPMKLDTNKHFGFCCLFFVYLEIQASITKRRIENYANLILKSKHSLLYFSRYIFIARFAGAERYDREIKEELDKCRFSQKQQDFIWKWVRREIDLVAIAKSEEEY